MKVSENELRELRPTSWPQNIRLSDLSQAQPELFADSWDAFQSLAHGSRDIVALLTFTGVVPPLSPDLDWIAISHQAGGLACHHPCFIGVELDLRPPVRAALQELASDYYEEAGGHFYSDAVTVSDLVAYTSRLAELGLHCNTSYRLFEEAVYPIDASDDHLSLIADGPPTVEAFAGPGGFGHPAIVILAENSD